MARIIDANKMLSMWAAVNPERRMIIHLSDPLLTNNNGSYIIENGKCFKTTNNEHIHAFEVLTMDIGQLAHFLIYPEQPFMSLMFD
jgi:predicted acetyltransferase